YSWRSDIRRYIFEKLDKFQPLVLPYLNPPFGNNLPQVLHNLPDLRKQVSDILRERGFRLLLKPVESEINLAKEVNEELFSYPFQTVSETWKRIMFMLAVLETNKDQVLLLDEPEANIFPFFNTQIAETIGLYNTNQFFITTHNPYLLQSLVAKTPKKDLCVFVTRMENFETKVHQMDSEQLSDTLERGMDIFLNLDEAVEV
ncbi:MAG TPA: AAA family ATPase, partial [Saprospiraceae bacterium]|nr:AAA family ATPase [Saprospiraceae bacterium]